ncbi:ExbD/TolR family protein [Paraburkholderia aspalathi]|uniref:ExbD/TolR family protein n=1 Tax=Paraburkholderia aspalathi TaxID=1324617 RepID=UPI003C9F8F24
MRTRAERKAMRAARRRDANELNIVSMIDVLTVLVFFLLVHTIGITSLGVDVPGRSTAPSVDPIEALTVEVEPGDLRVRLGTGQPRVIARHASGYDVAGLGALLADIKRRQPERSSATVLSAPGVAYGDLVTVMDAVRGDTSGQSGELFPRVALGDAPQPSGGL